jgi:hypothetical protein
MYLLFGVSMASAVFGLFVITSWPTPAEYRLIIAGIFWVIATVAFVGGAIVAHFNPDHDCNKQRKLARRMAAFEDDWRGH